MYLKCEIRKTKRGNFVAYSRKKRIARSNSMRGIRQAIRNYKGKPKRKRQKGPSIKFRVLTLITDGRDDQFIITSIKKEFPKSKFNKIHISWYRSTLHRDGIISPEFTAKKSRAYKEWAKSLEN